MTVLYTRWRFDNYTQDQESNFTYQNFFGKNSAKLCLHLSYIAQNSFHFDEFFLRKFGKFQFWFYRKNSVKLCLLLSYMAQNSFHFDEIFHRKFNIPISVCVVLRRHLVAILGSFAELKLIFFYFGGSSLH